MELINELFHNYWNKIHMLKHEPVKNIEIYTNCKDTFMYQQKIIKERDERIQELIGEVVKRNKYKLNEEKLDNVHKCYEEKIKQLEEQNKRYKEALEYIKLESRESVASYVRPLDAYVIFKLSDKALGEE